MIQLKFRITLTLITFVILSLFFFIPKTYAIPLVGTLFEDNFNSGNTNKWTVIGNSGWNVQNGQYGIYLNPGLSNAIPNNWDYKWQNISFSVDLRGVSGTDKNVLIKFVDPSNYLEIHHTGGYINLEKHSTNGGDSSLDSVYHPLNNNTTYHFRIDINQGNIKVYLDNTLILQGNEAAPLFQNWKIGLRAGTGAVSPTEVWYDNVVVTDLANATATATPTATPTSIPTTAPTATPTIVPTATPTISPTATPSGVNITVPDIKQYTSPWESQTYDLANLWFPSGQTIARWGCALTSANMILQKYGFTINPGDLNTWLKSQSDGYIPNGQLNWLAISRYSKLNSNTNLPALEYKRLAGTLQNLTVELAAGRPAILQEPGHFIVARSITPTSFGINDPAYANHPTLDFYNNSFEGIMTYTPSHTNLSYIMLTIDPKFNLKVFDTNGVEITGRTFIDEALIDDTNNSNTSGNSLKIFEFPMPPDGNYKVEVTGIGTYELDSYLYDVNGNPTLTTLQGIVTTNQKDEFKIIIGKKNSNTAITSIASIKNDLLLAKNTGRIKSTAVFNQINLFLNLSQGLLNFHFTQAARATLKATSLYIKAYTPSQIDPAVSTILQSELQTLINSL